MSYIKKKGDKPDMYDVAGPTHKGENEAINDLDKVITNVNNILKVLKKDVDENKKRTITNEKNIHATSKKSDEKANAKMKEMS